jgi:hypothetical protein
MPIDVLPDDVILAIFDLCMNQRRFPFDTPIKKETEVWQPLVHVCRRWRSVIFGSPHRLNLQLVCTAKTPARDTLDVWPALPLLIWKNWDDNSRTGLDNIIPVLERSDRVCQINLNIPSLEWEKVSAAMQEPFPELTFLKLMSYEMVTVLPDSFLGGSAPRLQSLWLHNIPFPILIPKLFLSSTNLSSLYLYKIPHSGYISPEAMFTALSTLTRLGSLTLGFASPRSCPDQATRRPSPLTHTVFPFLSSLTFEGVSEYLEDLVARIDAPRLFTLKITFFSDLEFDIPHTIQFIRRSPLLERPQKANLYFGSAFAEVILISQAHGYQWLKVGILCPESDWQVSSLEQICTLPLLPLSKLEDLYIHEHSSLESSWQDNVDDMQWLELLQPFTAVKNLYLSKEFAPRILPALQELVGSRATEVLPTLQNILLEELAQTRPVQEAIEQFVAARQVTTHPIAVLRWDNSERDKKS